MKTPRVSIAGLMGLVLFAAIGIALLKNASERLASLTLAATALLFAWAWAEAAFRRDPRPTFWIGVAVISQVVLAVGIVLPALVAAFPLPPDHWLEWLEPAFGTTREHHQVLPRDRFDEAFSEWAGTHPDTVSFEIGVSELDATLMSLSWTTSDHPAFQQIARCLLAQLCALLGGLLASVLAPASIVPRRRHREEGRAIPDA